MNAHDRNKDLKVKKFRGQFSQEHLPFAFLGMVTPEGDNIRRQYLSKILPPKLVPVTKDVSTPSEFLSGNNLNDRIETIETS